MSIQGYIEAKCPGCDETEEARIWSFVRGDEDEDLRNRIKSGDLNLVECPHCGRLFHAEALFVYADPSAGLVAFVFPESYAGEEERWRVKMKEDFEQMRPIAEKMGIFEEPIVFFGETGLGELVQSLEDLEDEEQVGEWYSRELGLSFKPVRPSFARERRLPRRLPFAGSPGGFSREAALRGLKNLVKANDRLAGYARWIEYLESPGPEPPFAKEPRP